MKKIIAIFLLLQISSSNAFAEELIKLPALFSHYYHHAQERHDTKDFFDFLHKHYSDHAHAKKDHENEKHGNLPFKHSGSCANIHVPALGFISSYFTADYNLYLITLPSYASENERIESQDIASIWQPPKLI